MSEVPPNASAGGGTVQLSADPITGSISGMWTVNGLGTITAADLHQAQIGSTAPILLAFNGVPAPSGTFTTTNTSTTVATSLTLNPGNFYVEIHTQAFPAGELRAQLTACAGGTSDTPTTTPTLTPTSTVTPTPPASNPSRCTNHVGPNPNASGFYMLEIVAETGASCPVGAGGGTLTDIGNEVSINNKGEVAWVAKTDHGQGIMVTDASGISRNINVAFTAGPNGDFTTTREVPANTTSGVYHVAATGVTSGKTFKFDVFLSSFTMSISSSPGNPAVTAGSSATLGFSGNGFILGEAIAIRSEPPGLFAEVDVSADANSGSFCCPNVGASAAAAPAAYNVVAFGVTSGIRITAPFNVINASFTPNQARAGDHPQITLSASGFTPGASITIGGALFSSTSATADANGQLALLELVTATTAGRYQLSLKDTISGGHVTTPVLLTGISYSANPVRAGSNTTVFVDGFQPNETVNLSAVPAGTFGSFALTADATGSANRALATSGVAVGGYTFTATGAVSGFTNAAVLEVSGAGLSISPRQVAAPATGQQFSLSGSGFSPNEYVDIVSGLGWANLRVQADANGAIATTLASTGGSGRLDVSATGRSSGLQTTGAIYLTGIDLSFGNSAPPNTPRSLFMSGSGFQGGETVQLTSSPSGLFSPLGLPADSNGNFSSTLALNGVAAGDYQIIGTGATSTFVGTGLFHVESFSLSPDAMVSGVVSTMTFSGAGFGPNETIDIKNDRHEDLFADFTTTTDGSGAFSVSRTLSGGGGDGFLVGAHARGQTTGIQQDRLIHKLSLSGDKSRSPAGNVRLAILGFAANGSVQLSAAPGGLFTEQDVALDSSGNASVVVAIPASASVGQYTLTAAGNASPYAASTAFVLDPPVNGNAALHATPGQQLFTFADASAPALSSGISFDNFGGGAALNWQATASSGSVTTTWLTLARTSGTTCVNCIDALGYTVNPAGLVPGFYDGSITLSGQTGTSGSPQTIPIRLTIQGAGSLSLAPTRSTAGSFQNVVLTGAGFGSGEVVEVKGGPWPGLTTQANAAGQVSVQTQVNSVSAGEYSVSMTGRATKVLVTQLFSLAGISLNQSSGRTGQSTALRISGAGYPPAENVNVGSVPAGLFSSGPATVDAKGAFNFAAAVPVTAAAGTYQVVATSDSGASSSASFVLGTLSLSPAQTNQHGTRLVVQAGGYQPSEPVDLQIKPQAGGRAVVDQILAADSTGAINTVVAFPANVDNAWYAAHAVGSISKLDNSASFYQTGVSLNPPLAPAAMVTAVQLTGGGFVGGEAINIAVTPPGPFAVPPLAADATGFVATQLSVAAAAGVYHVVLTGATSGFSATTDLHVGGIAIVPSWQIAGSTAPLTIRATGFVPNEVVHIGHRDGSTRVAPFDNVDHLADATGTVNVALPPTNLVASGFDVQAWDDQGAVSAAPYNQVSSALSNDSGNVGQANTLLVSGAGYLANETIQIAPNDARLFAPVTLFADFRGGFNGFSVTTNATATAGSYVLTIRGVSSGFSASQTYHIGSFTTNPAQAVVGQHPAQALQGSGYTPGEIVRLANGPWGSFTVVADTSGAIGSDGLDQRTSFYLTGLQVAPLSGLLGVANTVSLTGAGYAQGDTLSISASPDGLFVPLTALVDANGAWSLELATLPAASTGTYTITAIDAHGFTASGSFSIGTATAVPFVQAASASVAATLSTTSAPDASHTITLTNGGAAPLDWTSGVQTNDGGTWLTLSANASTIPPNGSQVVTLKLNPFGLAASTFGATITILPAGNSGGTPARVAVELLLAQGNAGLSISPRQAVGGTTPVLTLVGSGYAANETVTISGVWPQFTVVADATGSFSMSRQLPQNTSPGAFVVQAQGATSQLLYTAPVNVTALGPRANAGLTAGSGALLRLDVLGWQPGEPLSIDVSPAGLVDPVVSPADGAGDLFNLALPTKSTAPTGIYTVRVTGQTSGMQMSTPIHVLSLTVTPSLIDAGRHPFVSIGGAGYTPNSDVSIKNGPFGLLIARSDGSGQINLQEQVLSTDARTYSLQATDVASSATTTSALNLVGLSLSRTAQLAGADNTLFGGGFQPGEVVVVHTTPGGAVDDFDVYADASGMMNFWAFRTRTATPTGAYMLMATGALSSRQAQTVLEVSGLGSLGISPAVAPAGSFPRLTLTAQGLVPNELVDIDGPYPSFTQRADGNGSIQTTVAANQGGAGRYTLHANGRTSGISLSAAYAQTGLTSDKGAGVAVGFTGMVNFQGNGFVPGESVSLRSNPAGLFAPTTPTVDGFGSFYDSTPVVSAAPGTYTVSAIGETSGSTASMLFSVAQLRVSPVQYRAGEAPLITFRADGFQPGERVRLRDSSNPNSLFFDNMASIADASGSVSASFLATSTFAAIHQFNAHGDVTQIDAFATVYASQLSLSGSAQQTTGQSAPASFSVRGFRPNAAITLSSSPLGLFAPVTSATDNAGAVDFPVVLNSTASAGQYQVTATDAVSTFSVGTPMLLAAPGDPVLAFDVAQLTFVANTGDTAVSSQVLSVRNHGGGVINWTTRGSTDTGGAWLSADPAGQLVGSCCGRLTVRVNPSGLAAGVYTGALTVSAPGADSSPQTFAVRLSVVSPNSMVAAVTPAFGGLGQVKRLAITGAGFNPNEPVDVASSLFVTSRTSADGNGQVALERLVEFPSFSFNSRRLITLTGMLSGLTANTFYGLESLFVTPASALLGQTTRLSLAIGGMAPNEQVTISALPPGLFAPLSATVDSAGAATISLSTLQTASAGDYTLHVVGSSSATDVQQTFNLTQLTANPAQWQADAPLPQIVIQGSGYAPNEVITFGVERKGTFDSGGLLSVPSTRTDSTGSFSLNFQLQGDSRTVPGKWDLNAYGNVSTITQHVTLYKTDLAFLDSAGLNPRSLVPANTATDVVLRGAGFLPGEIVTLAGDTPFLGGHTSAVATTNGDWQDRQRHAPGQRPTHTGRSGRRAAITQLHRC